MSLQSKHRFHFQRSSSYSLRSLQLWAYLRKIAVGNRVQFYINQCNIDHCRASLHRPRPILIHQIIVAFSPVMVGAEKIGSPKVKRHTIIIFQGFREVIIRSNDCPLSKSSYPQLRRRSFMTVRERKIS